MVPETCAPLTSVRLDEPAVAVMVTAVALVDCQFRVTLWPVFKEFALAERLMVGGSFLKPPHDTEPHIIAIRVPQEIQCNARFIIG